MRIPLAMEGMHILGQLKGFWQRQGQASPRANAMQSPLAQATAAITLLAACIHATADPRD